MNKSVLFMHTSLLLINRDSSMTVFSFLQCQFHDEIGTIAYQFMTVFMLIRVRIETRWNKRRIQKLKSRHPEINCNKIIFYT